MASGHTLRPVALVAVLLWWWGALPAQGQWWRRQAPADIIQVEVAESSNAMRITLHANGAIDLDDSPIWQRGYQRIGGEWRLVPFWRVPFRLTNCRSRVGAFYNIGRYPVSHIEIGISPDDPLGVGLDVTIVLYRPAYSVLFPPESLLPEPGLGFDLQLAPNRQSVIFKITSDRFPPKPTTRVQPGPERPEYLAVNFQDGRVSVTARFVPIRRLLAELTAHSGERILLEDGLERTISLHVTDVTLRELLEGLARTYGLALSQVNGEWAIGEGVVTGAANYLPSSTRRFPLHYLSPLDALNLLPSFLLAYVRTDAEGNALVASGPAAMLDKIEADLRKIDVPPPQVRIDAIVAEVTSQEELESAFAGEATGGKAQLQADARDASLSLHVLPTQESGWKVRFEALQAQGVLRLRAQPHATVLNGRTANLFVGSQRTVQIVRSGWRGARAELRQIPVGVALDVTPWTGGGDITLEIAPAVTTIDEVDPKTGAPVIGMRRTRTTVRIRNGDTLLISGLQMAQDEEGKRHLPALARLPLVGSCFRATRRARTHSDLAIFVTARIL